MSNEQADKMKMLEKYIGHYLDGIMETCKVAGLPMDKISVTVRDDSNDNMIMVFGNDERIGDLVGSEFGV